MAPLYATRWHGEGLVAMASPSRLALPLPAPGASTSQFTRGSFDALNVNGTHDAAQCQILSYFGDIGVALHSLGGPRSGRGSSKCAPAWWGIGNLVGGKRVNPQGNVSRKTAPKTSVIADTGVAESPPTR